MNLVTPESFGLTICRLRTHNIYAAIELGATEGPVEKYRDASDSKIARSLKWQMLAGARFNLETLRSSMNFQSLKVLSLGSIP